MDERHLGLLKYARINTLNYQMDEEENFEKNSHTLKDQLHLMFNFSEIVQNKEKDLDKRFLEAVFDKEDIQFLERDLEKDDEDEEEEKKQQWNST